MKGFSLIELLIAVTLSLLLLDGVVALYSSFKQHYHYAESLASIQENMRAISQIFYTELATAGYLGCGKLSSYYSVIHDNNSNMQWSVQGYDATTATQVFALPSSGKASVAANTDVIAISKAQEIVADVLLMGDLSSVLVSDYPTFKVNDIVIISDCTKATIFQIKTIAQTSVGQQIYPYQLSNSYEKPAQISRLINRLYYIGDTGRKNDRQQALYALFSADFPGEKKELVDDILAMHITYGIPNANNAIQYFTQAEIKDWSKVTMLMVDLVLCSNDQRIQTQTEFIIKLQESQGMI